MGNRLYPAIGPHASGKLGVGEGQEIYWEESGNPDGQPAIFLHGGPGSGYSLGSRRFFDPQRYRLILFDQRGCGRSTPHVSCMDADLSSNTTWHSIEDIERLRQSLGIERWLVAGHSWGCTLALAYAEQHHRHVRAMMLIGVTMTRPSEIDWLYRGLARFFPNEWERFRASAGAVGNDGDLVEAYARLLNDGDPAGRAEAAAAWHDWEAAPILASGGPYPERWRNPDYRLARARIITHYFRHRAWLKEDQLLNHADKLRGIPGVMVQGRLDLEAPVMTAWELARAWSDGELVIVPNAGHKPSDAAMADAIVTATDRFAAGPD